MTSADFEQRLQQVEAVLAQVIAERDAAQRERDAAQRERDELRKAYEQVLLENERLRRNILGPKSEKVIPGQLEFMEIAGLLKAFEADSDRPVPNSQRKGKKKKARPHGRQRLPEHLPVERIVLEPPELQGGDTEQYVRIGEETSESIEWRPSSFVRVVVERPKYAKKKDEAAGVKIAELPDRPIDRGMAGPGLLAHVVVSKYCDHLPLHRQSRIFARSGVHLERSTLGGWVEQSAELAQRVVDAMFEDAMQAHCIATDATGVLVQAPKRCRRGHFWVMVADRDHVLFRYSRDHDGATTGELLGGYKGYVLADAHTVYDHLFRDGSRIEVGCWCHGRRYFFDALATDPERALTAIDLIKKLFEVERELADASPERRKQVRDEQSRPVVDDFFEWCAVENQKVLHESPIGAAFTYALNQEQALRRFLEDGRLPLENNVSERELRRQAVGRKNWLFVGSEDGARWNTVFVSLIASCALHDIEPWAYLRDLFCVLPRWPVKRVLELSPKHWNQTMQDPDAQQMLADDPFRAISCRD
jgi:transposase